MNATQKDVQRFLAKVDRTGECWIYKGGKTPKGYGLFSLGGKQVAAHRFAYQVANGALEAGKVIMHTCDNPSCMNPSHLVQGTQRENIMDMHKKGRANLAKGEQHWAIRNPSKVARGESHSMAKLSHSDVLEILASVSGKRGERSALARKYNVSTTQISHILNGKSRKSDATPDVFRAMNLLPGGASQ